MECLWCRKYSRQSRMMPSGPPEFIPPFIPPFIPVTGMKCSYGKISSPLTDSVREDPVFSALVSPRSDDWKYVCGSRASLPRSREPSQPALSYEHIENFTKELEVRRDLEHRASPVNRAHLRRPWVSRSPETVTFFRFQVYVGVWKSVKKLRKCSGYVIHSPNIH